jgi:uncharacterized ferritin-like protein (DUF455 family)
MTTNLFDAAYHCLMACDPADKVQLTQLTAQAWRSSELSLATTEASYPVQPILTPGQPSQLRLVSPKDVPRRTLTSPAGQAALLHALTHIEFNAINLAWDAVYRFRDLPKDFYADWINVADEEATHFLLLQNQLQKLGYRYGDYPAHNGLWEMAIDTAHDVLVRMALVPRLLEARGLDATPTILNKLQSHGLTHLVEVLDIILRDEIGHVACGSRWFAYLCAERQLEPEATFFSLIKQYFRGRLHSSLNREARLKAGFREEELEKLEKLFELLTLRNGTTETKFLKET